jgi:putative transposase
MAKPKLLLEPDRYYHIYNHSNGFENIFTDNRDRQRFLEKYLRYIAPIARTFAYCLMSNHFHIFIKIKPSEELHDILFSDKEQALPEDWYVRKIAYQFSHLFNSYAQSFNKRHNRMGGLFKSNFERKLVNTDKYFLKLVHYIHNNPVEHGFVDCISDWAFSSYQEITENKSTIVSVNAVIAAFGDIENFKRVHQQPFEKF